MRISGARNSFADQLISHPRAEPDPNDQELLRRVALRDDHALELLYHRFSAVLFSTAMRILVGRRYEAEEVLQETFLYAWRKGREYDAKRSTVRGWLVMLARSRALDRVRASATRERVKQSMGQLGLESSAVSFAQVEQRRTRESIERAFGDLSDTQRRMLELAFYDGLSHSEISEVEELPLGTVKTHIRRGLIKLSELLGDPTANTT